MADLFAKEGIAPPKDIFASEGIQPPSLQDQNQRALSPLRVEDAPPELQTEEERHRQEIDKLAKTRFNDEQIQAMKDKGPIGFMEAGRFLDWEDVTPVAGGIYQAGELAALYNAGRKLERGEELTDHNQQVLNGFIDQYVEKSIRGFSVGGGIAYYGAMAPAFMVEFALTGGVGKGAQEGVEAAVKQGVKSAVTRKVIGTTANIAARTAVMPQRYVPAFAERRVNDFMAVTDKGEVVFKESSESPATSALKAFAHTGIEVGSELSGAAIGKYVVSPVASTMSRYLKTPIQTGLQKLPQSVRQGIYQAYKAINPNATVSKVFSAAGWNGVLEELGEERIADILHASLDLATDKDFTFDDYMNAITPTPQQLMIEAGIIGIAGGVKSSANIATNILTEKLGDRKKAKETVDNMSASEQDAFVERTMKKQANIPTSAMAIVAQYPDAATFAEDALTGKNSFLSQQTEEQSRLSDEITDLESKLQGVIDEGFAIVDKYPNGRQTPTNKIAPEDLQAFKDIQKKREEIEAEIQNKQIERTNAKPLVDINISNSREANMERLKSFYDTVRGEGSISGTDPLSQSQNEAARAANPPEINNEESGFDKFYRDFVNSLQPIEDVTKAAQARGVEIKGSENPFTLSRTYAGVIGQIEHNLKYGTTRLNPETGQFEVTGKSMKAIMDDFDNAVAHIEGSRDTREADFNDYLIARRTLEDLKDREDVEVAEKDIVKSAETMQHLADKYGEDFTWFDTFALEMYEYQRRVLHNMVDAGILSEQQYGDIVSKNPNYIPFQRVLEEEHFAGAVSMRGVFTDANAKKAIKRIQGSDKDIKTTTHSVIANTAKIIDLSYRNRVATGIAQLADVMPEYIQPMPPTVVKRGTTQVKVTYDAGLRRKLQGAIKYFNNSLSQEKSLKAKGMGYVRGSYSPMEKMVRVRLGTNEGTLAHEVGHMLDYELGLMETLLADPKVKKELQELGRKRLSGQTVMTEKGERVVFEDRVLDVAPKKYQDYVTSDREIIANMFDAYVNAPDLLKKVAPNAAKAFDKIIGQSPELAFVKDIKPSVERAEETIEREVWGPLDMAPQGTITAYIDGKKKYYKVSEPLLEAMNNLSPVQMNATFRLLTAPFRASARILRAGATLIPEFWIRNVIRDQGTALLQSPVRPTPIDTVRGLAAVIGKNDIYQDWMRNGGTFNSYMDLDDKGLEKAYKELFRPEGKFARYGKNPINILADISMALEQATRIGAFSKARDQGMPGIEAALLAREATLDFGRGGVVSRNINQYIPFFNAGVQSVDKLARTFKENPKATAFWGIATITVPSLIITGYYLYGAPEEERQEYLEIPQWQRDMFWVFKVDGQWQRIPKPFSFGYLFGSVPERFMTWAYEGDKPEMRDFWKELTLGVAGTVSPVYDPSAMLPPLVKVAIEDLTNYNFFTGRNIYPEWMDRYEPEKRSNKYTSETAVALGQQLGVSPALLDNTLRGQLAGSATYITDAGDAILKQVKAWNNEPVPAEPTTPADIPVIKAFAVREPTGYGTNSVSNFFDDWKEVSQVQATFNSLQGEEKIQYREENATMIRAYKPMKAYYDRIRVFGKQSDATYDDQNMTSQEKVEALSQYGDQILDVAKQANQWYKENVKGQ